MHNVIGTGKNLKNFIEHPYFQVKPVSSEEEESRILEELNMERNNSRGPNVEVDYYFEVINTGTPMDGLKNAAKMIMEHGTLKPWHSEGSENTKKPARYDENMSWTTSIKLLGYNKKERLEAGLITIAYPLEFFDKQIKKFPLAQLLMAIASEPVSAFSFYRGARIIDIRLPDILKKRLPGILWPHKRIRKYLNLSEDEPIIGTIVKPKTGLTPSLFSDAVVQAAMAGAKFTKADENMHLTLRDIPRFVSRVVKDLKKEGFDLGRENEKPKGPRFLFAPHITTDSEDIMDYAKAAIEAGANALMFSPYYSGGFLKMAEIAQTFDVPVYSHTAGMNIITGSTYWGISPAIMYLFAAYFGSAFMQLPAVNSYLKPDETEKALILPRLQKEKLIGKEGMTLVIAGGLGPDNIGLNMKYLGIGGKMFLAGTSVYSHPDGPSSGVKALILAYRAYIEKGITDISKLKQFAKSKGEEGNALLKALI
ncbi:MAG: RuBisCO large subunit C-terminal-like domain-containing protein [bacterium]|nr:RuBisCO large subunit C-terminal-like domain-containing protein [bacterium]